ncbi:Uncharacterised protein [Staphylococcus aureus]|jgi:uncharacterized protein YebE (UPF0316 family)|uniref:hypothetical protein n=1 Tax=Staphylococcus aureus TaxID=1280 RepID=UPI000923DD64|nr:hypothetical protein [Staphylococcus aureus]SHC41102.1 Uncharacterised protein [Staphylococcus aureus]SHC95869.1 Uncharacterised protein [Staphylococcus aureus]
MKYRIIAALFFLILLLIYVFKIAPFLNTDSQIVNLVVVLIIFFIGALLGWISRKFDKNSK